MTEEQGRRLHVIHRAVPDAGPVRHVDAAVREHCVETRAPIARVELPAEEHRADRGRVVVPVIATEALTNKVVVEVRVVRYEHAATEEFQECIGDIPESRLAAKVGVGYPGERRNERRQRDTWVYERLK